MKFSSDFDDIRVLTEPQLPGVPISDNADAEEPLKLFQGPHFEAA
jgi:hypothetical protein